MKGFFSKKLWFQMSKLKRDSNPLQNQHISGRELGGVLCNFGGLRNNGQKKPEATKWEKTGVGYSGQGGPKKWGPREMRPQFFNTNGEAKKGICPVPCLAGSTKNIVF